MLSSINIDGLRIAYRRAGEGPPLVLLHGGLSDSREWRRQIDYLLDTFDVIAWDSPAAGRSSDPDESFGMGDYADCLAALLKALDVGPSHVVGHSWGGTLALELYRRHDSQVASLILCDTYAGWVGSLGERVANERLVACLEEAQRPPVEIVPAWIPGLLTKTAPSQLAEEVMSIMLDLHPAGYGIMVRTMMIDQRDILPRIRVPTLLIWGEGDARSQLSVAEEIHAAVSDSKLVVIPNAGHLVHLEQPEAFNAAVRDFCLAVQT
jgi:pimeloyl-ACP methyl ester carboxylesterase